LFGLFKLFWATLWEEMKATTLTSRRKPQSIALPEPQIDLSTPLMEALNTRRTRRKWRNEAVPLQHLSNLLWAGCGISFPESKRSKCRRTAPSACNAQAVGIYAATRDGLFKYIEKSHSLLKRSDQDIRQSMTTQKRMQDMPLGLVYVCDDSKLSRFTGKDIHEKRFISAAETGYISQNVYLYCTVAKLSTAVIALVNREKLGQIMGLNKSERVVFTQAIGSALD